MNRAAVIEEAIEHVFSLMEEQEYANERVMELAYSFLTDEYKVFDHDIVPLLRGIADMLDIEWDEETVALVRSLQTRRFRQQLQQTLQSYFVQSLVTNVFGNFEHTPLLSSIVPIPSNIIENNSTGSIFLTTGSAGWGSPFVSFDGGDSGLLSQVLERSLVERKNKVLSEEMFQQHCVAVDVSSTCEESCCVCMSDLKEEECVKITTCAHIFHRDCIHSWLTKEKHTCPVCRKEVCSDYVLVDNHSNDANQHNLLREEEGEVPQVSIYAQVVRYMR